MSQRCITEARVNWFLACRLPHFVAIAFYKRAGYIGIYDSGFHQDLANSRLYRAGKRTRATRSVVPGLC